MKLIGGIRTLSRLPPPCRPDMTTVVEVRLVDSRLNAPEAVVSLERSQLPQWMPDMCVHTELTTDSR
jgi:hypothetical protein